MYIAIHIISIIIALAFSGYHGYKLGIGKAKSVLISVFCLMTCYIFVSAIPWFESGEIGSLNMVKIYAFTPPFYFLASKVFKVPFRNVCDLNGIWPMILFGLSHMACLIPKCCGGYVYLEGTKMCALAQALTGTNMIPNQLMESIAGLIIALAMFILAYKKDFKLNGRHYFIMIIVYGIQRFFWEFLRNNNKIIIFGEMTNAESGYFGLSDLSFYCIAMIAVGVVFIIALNIIDKKKGKEN
ncbi:MAG: prolipoprotein diacylglyceryl transferase [Clostridia bacterium]|nr:prolipoprotein diacylglyceryl transferase [Clostridia bacterium]